LLDVRGAEFYALLLGINLAVASEREYAKSKRYSCMLGI
jgi:hypothetical protein